MISVIMPAYNAEAFIGQAVQSVLDQSYPNLELIIVDNYSSDGTERIIQTAAGRDPRIRYRKFRNEGVIGRSRNVAVQMARGRYLAFLDADDLWMEDKLEQVMKVFEGNPGLDFVCHAVRMFRESDGTSFTRQCGKARTYRDLLFQGNAFFTSAVVVKKEKVCDVGAFDGHPDSFSVEDYDLWLRLAMTCTIQTLQKVLGAIRVHESASLGNLTRHVENTLLLLRKHYGNFPDNSLRYRCLMKKRDAFAWYVGGRLQVQAGKFQSARPFLLRALAVYPFSIRAWVLLAASFFGIRF